MARRTVGTCPTTTNFPNVRLDKQRADFSRKQIVVLRNSNRYTSNNAAEKPQYRAPTTTAIDFRLDQYIYFEYYCFKGQTNSNWSEVMSERSISLIGRGSMSGRKTSAHACVSKEADDLRFLQDPHERNTLEHTLALCMTHFFAPFKDTITEIRERSSFANSCRNFVSAGQNIRTVKLKPPRPQ